MTYPISITPADIASGIRFNGRFDPVSLAAWRVFPQATLIQTTQRFLLVDTGHDRDRRQTFVLPDEVQAFSRRFEAGRRVEPMTFCLEESTQSVPVPI